MGCGASSSAAMSPSASHPSHSQAHSHSQARFHVIAGGSGGGGDVPLLGGLPLTGSSLALTGLSSALNNLDFAETSSTATNVEDFLAPTVPQKNDVPSTTKSQQGTLDKDDDARTNDTATASASASASASATQQEDSSFPRLSVRLAWLRRFVDSCKGKKYTWTARDFLKAEHGCSRFNPRTMRLLPTTTLRCVRTSSATARTTRKLWTRQRRRTSVVVPDCNVYTKERF